MVMERPSFGNLAILKVTTDLCVCQSSHREQQSEHEGFHALCFHDSKDFFHRVCFCWLVSAKIIKTFKKSKA